MWTLQLAKLSDNTLNSWPTSQERHVFWNKSNTASTFSSTPLPSSSSSLLVGGCESLILTDSDEYSLALEVSIHAEVVEVRKCCCRCSLSFSVWMWRCRMVLQVFFNLLTWRSSVSFLSVIRSCKFKRSNGPFSLKIKLVGIISEFVAIVHHLLRSYSIASLKITRWFLFFKAKLPVG